MPRPDLRLRNSARLPSLLCRPSGLLARSHGDAREDVRNSRAVGYQGLSSRPSNQRQSGTLRNATNVGWPSAPARCAFIESDATIRSRLATSAAVSWNASSPVSEGSSTCSIFSRNGTPRSCSTPGRFCSEIRRTSGTSASGANAASGIERPLSWMNVGLPCQEMPILNPDRVWRAMRRRAADRR
jgi:hypothetical protein